MKIAILGAGYVGLDALLDACRERLRFGAETAPVADADLVFIAVGTPAGQNGEAHIGFVEDAAREVAAALNAGHTLARISGVGSQTDCGEHAPAGAGGCAEFLGCGCG